MPSDLPDFSDAACGRCASCGRAAAVGCHQRAGGPFHCASCWGERASEAGGGACTRATSDWWTGSESARAWLARARSSLLPYERVSLRLSSGVHDFDVLVDATQAHFHGVGAKKVWPAVHRITQYLDDASGARGRPGVAIELGAGCGVPGMLLGRLGWDVTLTDLPPLLPLTALNVEANASDPRESEKQTAEARAPRIAPLRWGVRVDADALLASLPSRPDLVFGSDITYFDDDYEPLLQTLLDLGAAESILAIQHRNQCHEAFAEAARARGWRVEPATTVSHAYGGVLPQGYTRSYACARASVLRLTREVETPAEIAPFRPKMLPAAASGLLRCEFDASLFLCLAGGGDAAAQSVGTAWHFLDELPSAMRIPRAACELVADCTAALDSLRHVAEELRESGMLGHADEVSKKLDGVRTKRVECFQPYCLTDAATVELRGGGGGRGAGRPWDASKVAAELSRSHCCVVDGFMSAEEAAALRASLGEMKASGVLQPGEVSGGLKRSTRGDLMAWVSTSAEALRKQPVALHGLLGSIDEIVGELSREPLLSDDLGGGKMLVRHEMQCTCYPGNGARYVKHVDDALKHRGRRLTCIAYCNDRWRAADGGELRLHLSSGVRDVAPLGGRLVLFWSDSRCPHEVLPAHAERYAVSVWFSDAVAVAEAATAEAQGRAGRR